MYKETEPKKFNKDDFLDALYSRNFALAREIGSEIGEEVPIEYLDPDLNDNFKKEEHELLSPIKTTRKKLNGTLIDKMKSKITPISSNSSTRLIEEERIKNVNQKTYNIFVLDKPPQFVDYKFNKQAPEYKDPNFKAPSDAEGVKEIYKIPTNSIVFLNEQEAIIMQRTPKKMKYYFLKSSTDRDGEIRPELPIVTTKTFPLEECIEQLFEKGNFERPGIILPTNNYKWKTKVQKAYNASNKN